ncbi:hypothetical protein WDW37_05630 [Bdellovibrionota bacterium FG-1]
MSEWRSFETRVCAKWVLAGEHSVLRGIPAVTLPHPEFALRLVYDAGERDLFSIQPTSAQTIITDLLSQVGVSPDSGRLILESSIPMGAGLGSSAALCVALARWLETPLQLPPEMIADFATRLENRFHGQSSGMDIAAILAETPAVFVRGEGALSLGVTRIPRFTFHDTGLRARTSQCIEKVRLFREQNPQKGNETDFEMKQASGEAIEGLKAYQQTLTSGEGLKILTRAMDRAHACFEVWGLVPPEVNTIREQLAGQGALASKLTGAGCGGMVVALWE